MSLADDIRRNTQAIIASKQALAETIVSQGGNIDMTSGTPSFEELNLGIASLTSASGETATVLATGDIQKGDVCSLTDALGGFEAMETRTFPVMAQWYNSGTGAMNTVALAGEPVKLDSEGKLIFMKLSTSSYYFPFCLVNGQYAQMTIDGKYARLRSAGENVCYDVVTNNLFWTTTSTVDAYHIDFNNLNITFLVSGPNVTGNSSSDIPRGCQMAYNNHFIVRIEGSTSDSLKMYRYDPTENIITLIADMLNGGIVSYGKPYYGCVRSFVAIGDDLYVFIFTKATSSASSRIALLKFTYSTLGQYVFVKDVWSDECSPGEKGKWAYKAQMDTKANLILYINKQDNLLHGYKINKNTVTVEDIAFAFSDNLTSIDTIAMVRNTNLVYVCTTDTNIPQAERVRLYSYDIDTGICTFVCFPAVNFTPNTMSNVLPVETNLIDSKYTIYQKADNTYAMYKVGYATREYDVIATPCNNTLVDGVDGYGIAQEDIAMGSMGSAIVILKS